MAGKRRTFGPLTYGTAVVAVTILVIARSWPVVSDYWRARALFQQYRAASAAKRPRIAEQLGQLGQLGPASAFWAKRARQDSDPSVRILACSILWRQGSGPEEVLPTLRGALDDPDPAVRLAAVSEFKDYFISLGIQIGPKVRLELISAFRKALLDRSTPVRAASMDFLGSLGPEARPAVGDLETLLGDRDPIVRVVATKALLRIDPTHSRAVATLGAMLTDPESGDVLFEVAAVALAESIGEDRTIAMLVSLLGRDDPRVRHRAAEVLLAGFDNGWVMKAPNSLDRINPAVGDLEMLLGDRDLSVRIAAAMALLQIDPTHSRAVATLGEILADPETGESFLDAVFRALGESTGDDRAIAILVSLLRQGDPRVRDRAVDVLLGLADENQRRKILESLDRIDPKAAEGVRGSIRRAIQASAGLADEDEALPSEIGARTAPP